MWHARTRYMYTKMGERQERQRVYRKKLSTKQNRVWYRKRRKNKEAVKAKAAPDARCEAELLLAHLLFNRTLSLVPLRALILWCADTDPT